MSEHRIRMNAVISSLLAQNTPPTSGPGPEPTPAMECQVRLRSGYQIQGVLSRATPILAVDEERREHTVQTLRMAMPALVPHPDNPRSEALARKVIAEHFFDYEDVECIVLIRDVAPERSKPSIILGGG